MERASTTTGAGVLICSGPAELAEQGALAIAGAIARKSSGMISLALSGGGTPKPVYKLLATRHRDAIPWDRIALFWGDERYVPHDSPASNYRMAHEAMIGRLPLPFANVHPVPVDLRSPEEAARAYEETLRRELGSPMPALDISLLGLGDDGHTASLFPGSPALLEEIHATAVAEGPAEPRTRITLTLPVLNHARNTIFLVSGKGKHGVLRSILDDPATARSRYPAAMIQPEGTLLWITDRDAYYG